MIVVLKHNETGRYVARSGSAHSYTPRLEEARAFASRAEAEMDRCVESEHVVEISEIFR